MRLTYVEQLFSKTGSLHNLLTFKSCKSDSVCRKGVLVFVSERWKHLLDKPLKSLEEREKARRER